MYCKHCGTELGEREKSCENCGYSRGYGSGYCPGCGRKIPFDAEDCRFCGAEISNGQERPPRRRIVAGLMGILLGFLGIHNFYLGYFKKGLFKLILSLLIMFLGLFIFPGLFIFLPLMLCWGVLEGTNILFGNVRVDAWGVFLK